MTRRFFSPASSSRLTMCVPRNPVPPVTRIFFEVLARAFVFVSVFFFGITTCHRGHRAIPYISLCSPWLILPCLTYRMGLGVKNYLAKIQRLFGSKDQIEILECLSK